MAAVKSRDTKPELKIRRGLHRRGFRFTLHRKDLPGTPDLVLPRRNAVIFVHGCFWHGHTCHLFRSPQTRSEFWQKKIDANRRRDTNAMAQLNEAGWRIGTVWECALRGSYRMNEEEVFENLATWLTGAESWVEIRGTCVS